MRSPSSAAPRSPQAWWRISAAAGAGGAVLAASSGWGALAAVLAMWAIVSLYGSVDHLVEPAMVELLQTMPAPRRAPRVAALHAFGPTALTTRQRRVLRLLAYGLPEDEVAELLKVGEPEVRSDVAEILARLGVDDLGEAIDVAHRTGFVAGAQGQEASSAA
jgi:DNA-binding NarL/FixJ family response regulator